MVNIIRWIRDAIMRRRRPVTLRARRAPEGIDEYRVNGERVAEDEFWRELRAGEADVTARWNTRRRPPTD